MANSISTVKTFSATMAKDRALLGERVTAWLSERPELEVLRTIVKQSSDRKFHCISVVLICGGSETTAQE